MFSLSELKRDIVEKKSHFLKNAVHYCQFINELNEFVLMRHELSTDKQPTLDLLNKLCLLKGQPTSEKIAELTELLLSVEAMASPMESQTWFMEKMIELGYSIDMAGQCFGMSHMAMNAFLAEDEATFNTRLKTIYHLSTDDMVNHLRSNEKMTPHDLDILAFFDTLTLYQQPQFFPHLFNVCVNTQNAERIAPIISPTYFTAQPKKKPTLILTIGGLYSSFTLTQSLDLLAYYFDQDLFSLILLDNHHAITLNYHPKKQWSLLDANHLPGQSYRRTELLAEAIFNAFGIPQVNGQFQSPLLMRAMLYTQQQNQVHFMNGAESLKQEPAWRCMHNAEEVDLTSLLWQACFKSELSSIKDLLDQKIQVTDETFISCCEWSNIQAATLLLSSGFSPTQALMEQITFSENHCPLTWGKWIKSIGLIPPLSLLKKALLKLEDLTMASSLIDLGVQPTEAFFRHVCFSDDSRKAIDFLMNLGIKPDSTLLFKLYEAGRTIHAKHLILNGIEANEAMIISACCSQDYDMVDTLLNHTSRLSANALNSICNQCDPRINALVIARHSEIISHMNYVNSYGLNKLLNFPICLSIIKAYSDKVLLSALQYLKQNGTRLSYNSLEYACWSNHTECVRWLVHEGFVLPKEVFNALKTSLTTNIIDLLSPSFHRNQSKNKPVGYSQASTFFMRANQQFVNNYNENPVQSTFTTRL